ncbi:carboxypeptidase-like regulatory domain-containing protein [Marinifilum sp.]|uniref:carboxypeptidase-like regulatory domain-containing protein n=1 Tax=Marinifilum sp. TaxID=2033137 RepID=UPI003BAA4F0B
MNTRYILLLLLPFILLSSNCFAQSSMLESTISISGLILSEKNKNGIENAIVTIKRTRRGVISDSSGVFHLQIQANDTLVISSMGYEIKEWPVPFIIDPNFPPFFQIYLKNHAVLLKEVNVYALGTWEDFKNDFVKAKTPAKKNMGEAYRLNKSQLQKVKLKELERTPPNVVQGLLSIGSGLFKTRRKDKPVYSDKINSLHQQRLYEKFNRKIVSELTNETGKTLEIVYNYISRKGNFIYHDSEIEIQKRILKLYEEYKLDPEKANSNVLDLDANHKIPNHLRP